MSANKAKLIDESRSPTEILMINLAEEALAKDEPVVLSLAALRSWAAERLDDKVYETAQSIGRLLRNQGMFVTAPVKIAGQRQTLVVNRAEMIDWEPGRLRDALKGPASVIPDAF